MRVQAVNTNVSAVNNQEKINNAIGVRGEDGTWIGTEINPQDGSVLLTTTKFNWGQDGTLESTEKTLIPTRVPAELWTGRVAAEMLVAGVKQIQDLEHNSTSTSIVTDPLRYATPKTLTTVKTDPVTGEKTTITYKPSDVEGIYNVTETDAAGNSKVITSAVKSPDGSIRIVKNMESLDGTTTKYLFTQDASGNHIRTFNQITDKDGKVLSTIDRTYDRVSDDLAFSSVNGRNYTIEHKGKNTIITDEFLGEKTVLNEKSFKIPFYKKPLYNVLGKVIGFEREKTDEPVIQTLLHTLPGDTLLKMREDVKYIVPLKDNLDSAFMGYFGLLNCNTDVFVVSHELGHSQDTYLRAEYKQMEAEAKKAEEEGRKAPEHLQNPIADQPEFYKEYVQEKAAFIKAFPSFQEEYIDYFIFETDGQRDRGRKETVAETNAMNSQKPMPVDVLAMRTQVLQQYFPRTIAAATRLMNPIAIPSQEEVESGKINDSSYQPQKEIIIPKKEIVIPKKEIILP